MLTGSQFRPSRVRLLKYSCENKSCPLNFLASGQQRNKKRKAGDKATQAKGKGLIERRANKSSVPLRATRRTPAKLRGLFGSYFGNTHLPMAYLNVGGCLLLRCEGRDTKRVCLWSGSGEGRNQECWDIQLPVSRC